MAFIKSDPNAPTRADASASSVAVKSDVKSSTPVLIPQDDKWVSLLAEGGVHTSPMLRDFFRNLITLKITLFRDFSNITPENIKFRCEQLLDNGVDENELDEILKAEGEVLEVISNPEFFYKLKTEFVRRPKVLLTSDLDQTLFVAHTEGIDWIGGSEARHTQFFDQLEQDVREVGAELELAFATAKTKFDDVLVCAVNAFQLHFMKSSHYMVQEDDKALHCIVNDKGKLKGCSISKTNSGKEVKLCDIPSSSAHSRFSHVLLTDPLKSSSILPLAKALEIPVDRVLLVDDRALVRDDANKNGIETVSTECFEVEISKDGEYVKVPEKLCDFENLITLDANLSRVQAEIREKMLVKATHAVAAKLQMQQQWDQAVR